MGKLGLLLDVFPGFTSFSYPLVIKHGNGHFLMCRFYIFFGKPSFIDGFPIATFDYQRVFSNHTDGQSIPLRKSARSRLSRCFAAAGKMRALQALVQKWVGQNVFFPTNSIEKNQDEPYQILEYHIFRQIQMFKPVQIEKIL